MGVFRQFPYSNFHEMNMDEIIKIIKNMLEEWAQYHAEWDQWMSDLEASWTEYQDDVNAQWAAYQNTMNTAWQSMQNFINNYFDNLDVQEEINNKIVSMIQTGEFGLIVNDYVPPAVNAWLNQNITQPTGVVIDTSLTVAGACADAKVTGDEIRSLKSDVNNLYEIVNGELTAVSLTPINGVNVTASGSLNVVGSPYTTYLFSMRPDAVYRITGANNNVLRLGLDSSNSTEARALAEVITSQNLTSLTYINTQGYAYGFLFGVTEANPNATFSVGEVQEETGLSAIVTKLNTEVDAVTETVEGKNIFFSEWSESGKGINLNTGAVESIPDQRRTGFVTVDEETTYTASCVFPDAPNVYFMYYDAQYNYLSHTLTPYGFYPKTFTTPADTAFVRVLHTSGGMPTNYQIEVGSTATTYEAPYKEVVVPYSKVYGAPDDPTSSYNISNKKWLFLGDSITAMTGNNSWVDKFKVLVSANANSFNQAVGGAKWCDSEAGIVYNGTPYESQNFIGNQVAWCQNIGFASNAFDCIIISAGTNDDNTSYPSDADIETQFYNGTSLIDLSNVNRSTWQGAIRWTVQTLKGMYPNATIVLLTPLQRMATSEGVTYGDMYPTIRQKRETIVKMAHRMGVYVIDTDDCNITDMQSAQFDDGLHLSPNGATTMANYIFRKIMPIMCDYTVQ